MISHLITKYRSKGILVDTNLLLLLFIGGVSESNIESFKRTKVYSRSDYQLLLKIIDKFQKLILTPNVLTEVSNLTNGLTGQKLEDFYATLKNALLSSSALEIYAPSVETSELSGFSKYGLADTGIISVAKNKFLVLSDDLRFTSFAAQQGVDCVNFNHLREAEWQS